MNKSSCNLLLSSFIFLEACLKNRLTDFKKFKSSAHGLVARRVDYVFQRGENNQIIAKKFYPPPWNFLQGILSMLCQTMSS